MTTKEAMQLIVENRRNPALNYAVNYAIAAMAMEDDSNEFKVQCLYVLNNISSWRFNKMYSVTKEEIKECRDAIKKGGGLRSR